MIKANLGSVSFNKVYNSTDTDSTELIDILTSELKSKSGGLCMLIIFSQKSDLETQNAVGVFMGLFGFIRFVERNV